MERTNSENRIQKVLLDLVAGARLDQRMAHSIGAQGWKNYLDNISKLILTDKTTKKHDASELLRTLRHGELTAEMTRIVNDFSSANPLAKIRADLGITEPGDEQPFEVLVANVQLSPGKDVASKIRADNWKLITDFDPYLKEADAFVYDSGEGVPLLVLHTDTARALSDATDGAGFDRFEARAARELIAHEYVHTQFGMNLDRGAGFGQLLNEIAAERKPQFAGYAKELSYLEAVSMISGIDIPGGLHSKATAADPSSFYRKLGEALGPSHALMVSGLHVHSTGNASTALLPFRGDPELRRARVLDSLVMSQIHQVGSSVVKDRIDGAVRAMIKENPGIRPTAQLEKSDVFIGPQLSTLLEYSFKTMTNPPSRGLSGDHGRSTL